MTRLYYRLRVPELSLLLVVVCRSFHVSYLIDHLVFGTCDCTSECRLLTPLRPFTVGWHLAEIFAIPPTSSAEQYIMVPPWFCALIAHHRLLLSPLHVLSNYSPHIFNDMARRRLSGLCHVIVLFLFFHGHFSAWPIIVLYHLRAVLSRLIYAVLTFPCRLRLASLTSWRRLALMQSWTVLFSTFPCGKGLIAVALMLIGHGERHHQFRSISALAESLTFRFLVSLHPVVEMWTSPFVIVLYL